MQSCSVIVITLAVIVGVCHGQFFQSYQPVQFGGLAPPPLPIARAIGGFQNTRSIGHRAVIENSEAESHLPEQFKNPFYKNPRIAQALAKESWFINGEEEVKQREAEKIPRQKVYSILKQAGFI